MIVIIDYGAGNLRSVINAFRYIGSDITVTRDPAQMRRAKGLILPGVGACAYAMRQLSPLVEVIREQVQANKPLLGVCLGYQLLFDESHEKGITPCLGLIGGKVIPIPPGRTIPHMGWNYVAAPDTMQLMRGLTPGRHFAFVHSYYADVTDPKATVASVEYEGLTMTAAVEKGNLFGCQFHPEKSGDDGLQLLRNFVAICNEESVC